MVKELVSDKRQSITWHNDSQAYWWVLLPLCPNQNNYALSWQFLVLIVNNYRASGHLRTGWHGISPNALLSYGPQVTAISHKVSAIKNVIHSGISNVGRSSSTMLYLWHMKVVVVYFCASPLYDSNILNSTHSEYKCHGIWVRTLYISAHILIHSNRKIYH